MPANFPMFNASKQFGVSWRIVACRPGRRGELVYHGAYDKIAALPDDSPPCVCDCIIEMRKPMKCPLWFAVLILLVMFPAFAIGFVASVFLRTLQLSHQAALEFVSWVADQQ